MDLHDESTWDLTPFTPDEQKVALVVLKKFVDALRDGALAVEKAAAAVEKNDVAGAWRAFRAFEKKMSAALEEDESELLFRDRLKRSKRKPPAGWIVFKSPDGTTATPEQEVEIVARAQKSGDVLELLHKARYVFVEGVDSTLPPGTRLVGQTLHAYVGDEREPYVRELAT